MNGDANSAGCGVRRVVEPRRARAINSIDTSSATAVVHSALPQDFGSNGQRRHRRSARAVLIGRGKGPEGLASFGLSARLDEGEMAEGSSIGIEAEVFVLPWELVPDPAFNQMDAAMPHGRPVSCRFTADDSKHRRALSNVASAYLADVIIRDAPRSFGGASQSEPARSFQVRASACPERRSITPPPGSVSRRRPDIGSSGRVGQPAARRSAPGPVHHRTVASLCRFSVGPKRRRGCATRLPQLPAICLHALGDAWE